HDRTDAKGPLQGEGAGGDVAVVPQLLHGQEHLVAGALLDARVSVENSRDGHVGDTCGLGDLAHARPVRGGPCAHVPSDDGARCRGVMASWIAVLGRRSRPWSSVPRLSLRARHSCRNSAHHAGSSRIVPSGRGARRRPLGGKAFAEIVRTLSSAATIGRPVPCPAGPSRSADSAAPPQAVCGAEESFTSRQRFPWWCGPGGSGPLRGRAQYRACSLHAPSAPLPPSPHSSSPSPPAAPRRTRIRRPPATVAAPRSPAPRRTPRRSRPTTPTRRTRTPRTRTPTTRSPRAQSPRTAPRPPRTSPTPPTSPTTPRARRPAPSRSR